MPPGDAVVDTGPPAVAKPRLARPIRDRVGLLVRCRACGAGTECGRRAGLGDEQRHSEHRGKSERRPQGAEHAGCTLQALRKTWQTMQVESSFVSPRPWRAPARPV